MGQLRFLGKLDAEAQSRPLERVVTASAGNHGLGLAYAARAFGVKAVVFVPESTPAIKRDGITALAADLVVSKQAGYDATEVEARLYADEHGLEFVSAYDDPFVAAGNGGTVAVEILDAMATLDAVVAPVGGGGLIAGIAAAIESRRQSTALIGVNTEVSAGMFHSFQAGRALASMPHAETVAEGLEGGVRPSTFEAAREAGVQMKTVSESTIVDTMRFAQRTLGLVVEGSGAVGIAWAREHLEELDGTGPVVLVVTGRNVD